MINKQLINLSSPASSGGGTGNQEEGLILHLDANDVDSYDGDGSEWVDITNHEYTPATNVSEHFNTVTFSAGTSGTEVINDVGFQPDFVWVKARNQSWHHRVFDSLRGVSQPLYSNETWAQGYNTDITLASFDTEGFTFNNYQTASNQVAWCFKAGGAAVSNTDGTITSQVSANNDLGFSIVEYTGNLSSSTTATGQSVGHGLDVAPELIIFKSTSNATSWDVFSSELGNWSTRLQLNTNGFKSDYYAQYPMANPTGSVFYTNYLSAVNVNNYNYIAYCFASKRGVSKVGSYTGTGAAGNKVVTGFEPAFLLQKETNTSGVNWHIWDNARDSNPIENVLSPNTDSAEGPVASGITFNRDGFTINTTNGSINGNGDNYIYYAVAKSTNETGLTPNKDDFTAGSVETTDLEVDLRANGYAGSGAWQDSSGNANHATLTAVAYTDNGDEDYFTSNGTTTEISVPLTLSTVGVATTELWVKGSSLTSPTGTDILFTKANGFVYGVFASGLYLTFRASNAANTVHSDVNYPLSNFNGNDWYHIAVTLSGASNPMKVYVNGEKVADGAAQPTFRTLSLYNAIMADVNSDTLTWNGSVAQFRTYSTTLTPAQIKSNYEATRIYNTPDLKLNLDAASFDGSTNTPSTWTALTGSNGTITGATFDSELGNWLDFDGSNDFVDLGDINGTNTELTVSAWVNPDSTQLQYATIFDFEHSNDEGWVMYQDNNNTNSYKIGLKDGVAYDVSDGFSLTANTWHHIAFTVNSGGAFELYVNGSNTQSKSGWGGLGSQQRRLNLGCWGSNDGVTRSRFWNGQIGQFRMYSSALTQAQIRQNYNFTKPSYPNGYDFSGINMNSADWNSEGYFDFDGSSEYFNNTDISLDTSKPFSVSVWFYPTQDSEWQRIFAFGTASTEFILQKRADNNNSRTIARVSNSIKFDVTGPSLPNNTWHLGVVTGDGSTIKMYINDSAAVTDSIDGAYVYNNLQIGFGTGTSEYFTGRVANLKVYDRVLSAAEITTIHSNGR